ncbi:MAG: SDR family oxidoreductase [Chloroflexota bacterium]
MQRFKNKIALVTGAARGIGRGIALKLGNEGATVVVNDFANMDDAEAVVEDIHKMGGNAITWQTDVTDREAVATMFSETVSRFGRLDICVANAAFSIREPVVEAEWVNVQRTIEVTQFGVYHVCQAAAQQMIAQDRLYRSQGKIVIIGSVMQEFAVPTSAPYNMAKAAVNHFARTLAAELTPHCINVNTVNPGWIDTPGERAFATDAEIADADSRMPWGRLGQPEDIANTVAFLASDEADYVTGADLRVDGGYMVNLKFVLGE